MTVHDSRNTLNYYFCFHPVDGLFANLKIKIQSIWVSSLESSFISSEVLHPEASISRTKSKRLGLGKLLDHRRLLFLADRAFHCCGAYCSQFHGHHFRYRWGHHFLDLFPGTALGHRRPHIRTEHALPRHFAGNGRGAGFLLCLRRTDTTRIHGSFQ